MISHKHKFLFIAVPKTASATARKIFEDLYDVHSTGRCRIKKLTTTIALQMI